MPVESPLAREISLAVDALGNIELMLTDLAAIVPAGHGFAYAQNAQGHLVGLKLATQPQPLAEEFYKWLFGQHHLERLVISAHGAEMPTGIAGLRRLRYLWLRGFRRLSRDLLDIDLPLLVDGQVDLGQHHPDYSRSLDWINSEFSERSDKKSQRSRSRAPRAQEAFLFERLQKEPEVRERILNSVVGIVIGGAVADPPIEIIARGRAALRAYYDAQSGDTAELNEVKLLMVGHGGAGKTSLLRRLSGESFNPDERQTHGINIKSLAVRTAEGRDVSMRTWDFGGQEIMHATHQFFLSKRSVYVIVLDGRKEEQAEYWLRHVQSFGGDAPTIVVLNKYDEHAAFDVNRRFLLQKYPSIVAFIRASCRDGRGLEELRQELAKAAVQVELLRTRWPVAWLAVKLQLEASKAPFLGKNAFEQFCREASITSSAAQKTLAQFLNDLGVIVHFSDFKLADTHVLSPHWLTGAVYRILTAPLLAVSGGIMKLSDISDCLESGDDEVSGYPQRCHGFILEIMRKFELCYYVDHESILVPDLLPVEEPLLDVGSEEASVLRYDYKDVVPRSVIPRLIVRLHPYVRRDRLWRTGLVVLEPGTGTAAFIRADYQARRIEVVVFGPHRRDFLAVIRAEFNHIHRSFELLGVTEKVPLPDLESVGVAYDHLLRLEEVGDREVFPEGAFHRYRIADLLGSVRATAAWSDDRILELLDLAVTDTDDRETAKKVIADILRLQPGELRDTSDVDALLLRFFARRRKATSQAAPLRTRSSRRIDVAIITAIEVERLAVCEILGLKRESRPKNGRWYWRGRLETESGQIYEVVAAQPSDMGQVEAMALAKDVLRDWRPRLALLVGIAATTDPAKARLGDVVVGKSIWYYEHAKVTSDGVLPQPEMMPGDAILLNHVTAMDAWMGKVPVARPDSKRVKSKVHRGVIATGEKVIADALARDQISSAHRKIMAIAMEDYGFTRAMWLNPEPVQHLVIRGISDDGSSAKDDGWHSFAAASAATFARDFLVSSPLLGRGRKDS